jgi:hypothetical protein
MKHLKATKTFRATNKQFAFLRIFKSPKKRKEKNSTLKVLQITCKGID